MTMTTAVSPAFRVFLETRPRATVVEAIDLREVLPSENHPRTIYPTTFRHYQGARAFAVGVLKALEGIDPSRIEFIRVFEAS